MNLWKRWTQNSNRIYMIPTRFGAGAAFLFLFFTVTGAHYSNNLIFLFAFILVSFLLVSILQTAKNLRGLDVLTVNISPGFPLETTIADILVYNKRSTHKFGMGLQIRGQKNFVTIDEILAGDKKWIQHSFLLPNKRGIFKTERIKIYTDAPYGLFYGWYYIYKQEQGLVYPTPKGQSRNASVSFQSGADFSGLKQFVQGDSIHRISWKHTAKREELLLKEFKDETPATEIYNINDCPQENVEDKLSQLSLWVTEAEQKQKTYAICLYSHQSPLGRGKHHLHECLYELGAFET
ncbi:MAG: DUF58 domain-containing protein [Bdellovibrionaceae bacterium]|nr:DUF58 domain-containing protein [Pseudobdellovibrionaceae bacterium]